jgi:exosortase/archaeosortase family protein
LATVQEWTKEAQVRWARTSASVRSRVKVGVLVTVTVVAYHYSLSSLLQTVGFDTPLAYVGLVPLIAAALAFGLRNPIRPEPAIHDRQLDYIIGVPLIVAAVVINLVLPKRESVLFWVHRMDLVSLPLFVAGAVAILFGTRVLWRQKLAILFLLLAWPWPYTSVLLGSLNGFTSFTVSGLNAVLKHVHLASPIPGGEAGLYQITHHGASFPVSVVSACSGVDGMVGFFLVGTAFAAIVQGPRLRKILWLAAGLVVLWTTNLSRILLIFWVGKTWGEHASLRMLHPVAGLVFFNVGIILMVLLLKPFGLRIGRKSAPPPAAAPPVSGAASTPRAVFVATGLLAVVSLVLAVNNNSFKAFDLVASASGDAKLPSFLAHPGTPAGWAPQYTAEYVQGKSYFGQSSRWFRYTYFDQGGGDLSASLPVTADVINAGGISGFSAYGVEQCYNFHGYHLRDVAQVSLGDGIRGQTLSYSTQAGADWSIVYWIWPVKTGTQTRYERVILYLLNTPAGSVKSPANVPGVQGLKGALSSASPTDRRLITNRAFLVAFAREIIKSQSKVVETASVNIGQITIPDTLSPFHPSYGVTTPRGVKRPAWLQREIDQIARSRQGNATNTGS